MFTLGHLRSVIGWCFDDGKVNEKGKSGNIHMQCIE